MSGLMVLRTQALAAFGKPALVAALAVMAALLAQQAADACEDVQLQANIVYKAAPQDAWSAVDTDATVCAGTTITFNAANVWPGVPATTEVITDNVDLDACDGVQVMENALYYWDFDFDSENYPVAPPGITADHNYQFAHTFPDPGVYIVHLYARDEPGTCTNDDDAFAQITVTVVEPDIDTDSDNDGVIEAEDDDIEELYPGKYVQINGALAQVNLGYVPSLAEWQLRLQATGSGVIGVYSDDAGQSAIQMPHTYTIPSVPSTVYVRGLKEESATLEWAYLDGSGDPACTDTVRFTAVASLPDEGLPKDNLNNAAGADRCNIRWSNPNTDVAYADAFTLPTLPSGNWIVKRIRMWTVPAVPVSPSYAMGDHYSAIALYGGSTNTLTTLAGGSLSPDSSSTTNITCTPVTYTGSLDYQLPDGSYNKVWQVDFSGLNWNVTGGTTYKCGMCGTPRYDRLWFSHAQSAASGQIWPFTVATGAVTGIQPLGGSGWFGNKESKINVQVFYEPQ